MATSGSSPYGMACPECNDQLIAPKESAYVNRHEIYHFWSCENCNHEMEVVVDVRLSAEPRRNEGGPSLVA
jgi:uncharacterized protein with PIN domain